MKAYKKFSTAKKNNPQDLPIVKCGNFYIVGMTALDETAIIDPKSGTYGGHITMRKLNALGNGNCATPIKPLGKTHPAKNLYNREN